ncbi:hypothetical protein DICPUDRAFT_155367 [Dictyostelium purpureum]|uniref:Uncharacterized protein n=1 Tax=Dictyostelium purpureum TaxID=5786 RepID=F0ZTT4_DICPU|nr:uncharacterized protein DICPUDRAFT_155367 [Dictyostelium purpureum]EGC32649.1 hypothetical protein DICPUDRAFT_155367 [Dictyostelium purpureum]|eukprot:XP_003290818.1 hypothetical protein DICPUDRAFT_155367 [Dictyostelium purpureum]
MNQEVNKVQNIVESKNSRQDDRITTLEKMKCDELESTKKSEMDIPTEIHIFLKPSNVTHKRHRLKDSTIELCILLKEWNRQIQDVVYDILNKKKDGRVHNKRDNNNKKSDICMIQNT